MPLTPLAESRAGQRAWWSSTQPLPAAVVPNFLSAPHDANYVLFKHPDGPWFSAQPLPVACGCYYRGPKQTQDGASSSRFGLADARRICRRFSTRGKRCPSVAPGLFKGCKYCQPTRALRWNFNWLNRNQCGPLWPANPFSRSSSSFHKDIAQNLINNGIIIACGVLLQCKRLMIFTFKPQTFSLGIVLSYFHWNCYKTKSHSNIPSNGILKCACIFIISYCNTQSVLNNAHLYWLQPQNLHIIT